MPRTDFRSTYELNPAIEDVLNEALYKDVADEGLKELYQALQERAGKAINENKRLAAQLEEITQDKLTLQSSLEDVRAVPAGPAEHYVAPKPDEGC